MELEERESENGASLFFFLCFKAAIFFFLKCWYICTQALFGAVGLWCEKKQYLIFGWIWSTVKTIDIFTAFTDLFTSPKHGLCFCCCFSFNLFPVSLLFPHHFLYAFFANKISVKLCLNLITKNSVLLPFKKKKIKWLKFAYDH